MFKSNTIKLGEVPVLPAHALRCVQALPGKVVVELTPIRDAWGGFELPDTVGAKYRANIGTVLSAGGFRNIVDQAYAPNQFLEPGDHVLCRPYDGMWLEGFESGGYSTSERVCFFGGTGSPGLYDVTNGEMGDKTDRGEFVPVDWWESVVAKIAAGMIFPTGDNVLAVRKKKEFAVLVPDDAGLYEDEVEVLAFGPFCPGMRKGMAVAKYSLQDVLDFDFCDQEGLILIPADCIHALIHA